jgi:protein-disulfide isomerase
MAVGSATLRGGHKRTVNARCCGDGLVLVRRIARRNAAREVRMRNYRNWLSAVVIGGTLVGTVAYRVWRPPLAALDRIESRSRPVNLPSALTGHFDGPAGARDTVTVFADFECPHCIAYGMQLRGARTTAPYVVAFRHRPLVRIHKYAFMAAVAAECAADQARFFEYADALFAKGGALSGDPWAKVAQSAGIPDTARFAQCLHNPAEQLRRVIADTLQANALDIHSTPATVIRGRLYLGTLRPTVIARLLAK